MPEPCPLQSDQNELFHPALAWSALFFMKESNPRHGKNAYQAPVYIFLPDFFLSKSSCTFPVESIREHNVWCVML